jgi:hypothetical protein
VKTLLNAILKDEHIQAGLSLTDNEDFVFLHHRKQILPVATFSAQGVTFEEILKEADKYLVGDAVKELVSCGGVSFGK